MVRWTSLAAGALVALTACQPREPKQEAPAAGQAPAPSAADAAPPPRAPTPPCPAQPARHLLLLSVDSLRADTSFNGYSRETTPRLARLAAESSQYSHAYALSSYTSMSLAGLMAGRYPSELDRDGRTTSSFGPDNVFLAELLQAAGFRTYGAHAHVWFLGATGIRQGFDDWRLVPRTTLNPARSGSVSDEALTDLLLEQLRAHHARPQPERFFAWAHYMDPHYAYARHEEHRFATSELGPSRSPLSPPLSAVGQARRDLYDGELGWVDAQLGRVLDYVDAQPWGKDTLIVVTADHGEAFGEHPGYFEHGYYLYDVTVRVPLLLRIPGVAPRRLSVRRSHLDLARTLAELLGVTPAPSMRGESLVPELCGAQAPERELLIDLPYTDQTPRRRALIHRGQKLIVSETEPRPLLYDLEADPAEQQDLSLSHPELLQRLRQRWERLNAAYPDFPAPRRQRGY